MKKLDMSLGQFVAHKREELELSQEDLANKVIDEDISVRQLESMIYDNPTTKVVKEKKKEENEYGYVETYLKEKLGTNVKINNNKMVIKFSSIHDLNRILEIMNINIDE